MNDSGSSSPPPSGTPKIGPKAFPPAAGEQSGKIESIDGVLRTLGRRTRIEGTVIRHNAEKQTVRVRTDKGDVVIQLRGRDLPPEGDRVEIDIEPGTPPRRATIRRAPEPRHQAEPALPQRSSAAPPREAQPQQSVQRPPDRLPPEIISEASLARIVPKEAPRVPLQQGDVVRLLPLTPQQTIEILQPEALVIETTITNTVFQAARFAAALPESLLAELLPTAPLQTSLPTANSTTSPLALFLLQASAGENFAATTEPAIANISFIQPGSHVSSAPAKALNPAHFLSAIPPAIAFDQGSSLKINADFSGLITHAVGGSAILSSAGKVAFLDLKIELIAPGQVRLTAPLATNAGKQVERHSLSGYPAIASAHEATLAITTKNPALLQGEVIGITRNNLPVLSLTLPGISFSQNFIVQSPAETLLPGTVVSFLPQSATSVLPGATPELAAGLPPFLPYPFFGSFDWPAMDDFQHIVTQHQPTVAQTLGQTMPNPATPNRLPAAALFFIAAVRSGDLGNWLGEKSLDILRRAGRGDVINRISRDLGGIDRTSTEPVSQDWRAMALPLYMDNEIRKMMLYYRRDGKSGEGDKPRGTRFIFDLELSRMGAVQLDSLHRAQRLDLIVRTHKPLSESMRQHMRRLYAGAIEQAGVGGELSFQGKPEHWVKIDMPTDRQFLSV